MNDEDKKRYAQLPPATITFMLPEAGQAKLIKKFQGVLDLSIDECHPEKDLLTFYKSLIITEILTSRIINIREFAHVIQHYHGHTFSPLEFEAAVRIIYDWVTTGGENAAKIGEPLD